MERNQIGYWAELTVKAAGFYRCASLRNKRGGNRFVYADTYAAKCCGLTVDEFIEARDAYLIANPMKYAATTGRLTYGDR